MENLSVLVKELCKVESENSCIEFKHSNYNQDMIGKDISASILGKRLCIYDLGSR